MRTRARQRPDNAVAEDHSPMINTRARVACHPFESGNQRADIFRIDLSTVPKPEFFSLPVPGIRGESADSSRLTDGSASAD
jgi:hypothetical protein